MAKAAVSMLTDISLNGMPVIRVVADFLAIAASGQQRIQLFHLGVGAGEFAVGGLQFRGAFIDAVFERIIHFNE